MRESNGTVSRSRAQSLKPARILITGGAGFIGVHLANRLLELGHEVRILDAFAAQVHGAGAERPAHLSSEVECLQGDVRNRDDVRRALANVSVVYHLAAAVGVGQSMYDIAHYTAVNNLGTAVLLECLLEARVQRLILASSMSIYGEGLYHLDGQAVEPAPRSRARLAARDWELQYDGRPLVPVPTPETKHAAPGSVYALSKYDQEQLCLMFGRAYHVPTVALRFFNVYGPHQALSNPYTGVLAIFAARCLNDSPPLIFEDGRQQRDFVHVADVVQACTLALTTDAVDEVFNIGSGRAYSIAQIADAVVAAVGAKVEPVVTGRFRVGDIRHCFADIDKARRLLGYSPSVQIEPGLSELAEWLSRAPAQDNFGHAIAELDRRGLTL